MKAYHSFFIITQLVTSFLLFTTLTFFHKTEINIGCVVSDERVDSSSHDTTTVPVLNRVINNFTNPIINSSWTHFYLESTVIGPI